MFGRYKYQNKVNDEIIEAAEAAYGKMRGWNDVMSFRVDGAAIGVAVNNLYKKASPLIAAQASVLAQIELCRLTDDNEGIKKWNGVLAELERKEIEI